MREEEESVSHDRYKHVTPQRVHAFDRKTRMREEEASMLLDRYKDVTPQGVHPYDKRNRMRGGKESASSGSAPPDQDKEMPPLFFRRDPVRVFHKPLET